MPSPTTHAGDLVDAISLRLLAAAACAIAIICVLILPTGPHESAESESWVLALLIAIPAGFGIAALQERRLAGAAPAAAARAVAAGVVIQALALIARRLGSGIAAYHGIVLLAALAALAAPFLAARLWTDPADGDAGTAHVIAAIWLGAIAVLFTPSHAWRLTNLIPSIIVAAVLAAALIWLPRRRWLTGRWRRAVDIVACVVLALVVIQLPPLNDLPLEFSWDLIYHQGFFLGPANAVLHGRAMLAGAWGQYGYGLIDALAAAFLVIPIGNGTLMLIVIALTVAVYILVFASVRLAGVGQLLTILTLAVAAVCNLFAPLLSYIIFPSATALRFGLPYAIVLGGVLGARYPQRRRLARGAILAVVALGAAWSFETFVYCAATYGCLVLVEALALPGGRMRALVRYAFEGIAAAALAVILFSVVTLVLDGRLDWGPYLEYITLYSERDFGTLPVVFFSAGPQLGAAAFFTGVILLWLSRYRPDLLAPPLRAALAGFTGIAIGTYTYYLGRSAPNLLLAIALPTIVLIGLWAHVLVGARQTAWRRAGLAAVALVWAVIVVSAWPSVKEKWEWTALSLMAPHNAGSLRLRIDEYTHDPAWNELTPLGEELLDRYWRPGEPALVLTQQDLTTELLVRTGRRNLLPVSHFPQDVIIRASFPLARESAAHVPAGTLMLTSPPQNGFALDAAPLKWNRLQRAVAKILHRRFTWERTAGSSQTLEVVRLVPRRD